MPFLSLKPWTCLSLATLSLTFVQLPSASASRSLAQASAVHAVSQSPSTHPMAIRLAANVSPFQLEAKVQGATLDIEIRPAPGTHVNLQAPASLTAGKVKVGLVEGKSLFRLSPVPADGTTLDLRFSMCDDANTWCRQESASRVWRAGRLEGNGTAPQVEEEAQVEPAPHAPAAHPGTWPGAIQEDWQKAMAQAQAEGKLLLVDFYGIWCPPCQLLVSQGFPHPAAKASLDKLIVLQLDADRQNAWTLKSRYQVTGYPTLILATPAGQEVSRFIGFDDPDAFARWLDQGVSQGRPLSAWVQKRAQGDRSPEVLLGVARGEKSLGLNEEAAALYREALPKLKGDDLAEARLFLLMTSAEKGDTKAVQEQVAALKTIMPVPRAVPWGLWEAAGALEESEAPKAKAAARKVALATNETAATLLNDPTLPRTFRASLHEVMGYAHQLLGTGQEKLSFSTAADLLLEEEAKLTGTGAEKYTPFRGQAHSLTDMLESAGRAAEAEAAWKRLIEAFPQEFTWHYGYAGLLRRLNRNQEALHEAELALSVAYGDNRLRCIGQTSNLLMANGKRSEAIALVKQALDEAQLPVDPTVRTSRYVNQLKELLSGFEAAPESTPGTAPK